MKQMDKKTLKKVHVWVRAVIQLLYFLFIPQLEYVFCLHPDHWNRFNVSVSTLYTSFIF